MLFAEQSSDSLALNDSSFVLCLHDVSRSRRSSSVVDNAWMTDDADVIIALTQLCWAVPVPKKDRKANEIIVMEPWSKHLTRLGEDSKYLQNNISCMIDEQCNTPILPYKPGKLSKGPKGSSGKEYVKKIVDYLKKFQKVFLTIEDSMKNLPASDKIMELQTLTNPLVNDVDSVLKINGVKGVKGGKNKKIKGLSDLFPEYFTTLKDFDSFLENVMSILSLE
ncbi:uncharacterized protein LOC127857186 [Dreissena polymorpha]|nr:uncharacterized protein LOC127857186 [Dreissena polymorpha]